MATGIPQQSLPPTQPPSTVEYGGDEIAALVLDPGTAWTRAGFAGEDTPKTVIPSSYGYVEGRKDKDGNTEEYLYGDSAVYGPTQNMDIRNPMADGIVQDWDRAIDVWTHALTSHLTKEPSEHPLLMTDPAWNPVKNREKTIEVAFEHFNAPAFYLARSAVCSGFASGKSSGLIIDVGASNISVTPVHDGFHLRKGAVHSPIGGDFLSAQIREYLVKSNIPLTPHYKVVSKQQVDVGEPAKATLRDFAAPEGFRRFHEERVLTEFKEVVAQVWPNHSGSGTFNHLPPAGDRSMGVRPFEFPDGYNMAFGTERYQWTEPIFDLRRALVQPQADPAAGPALPLTQLIMQSMKDVDNELKPHVLSNVVVTGGGSLLYGFTDRLNAELSAAYAGPRVRITAPGNTVERKYAAWLGGSILASLGSFHQMWVSKKEYEEHGSNIVEKRCK